MAAGNHGDVNSCDREPDLDSCEAELFHPRRSMGTTNLQAGNQLHNVKPKMKVSSRTNENGGYSSFSSKNSDVPSKVKDREPGELSSESGSDDIIDSETKKMVDEVEGNGFQAPAEKKRKFSPIVWDMDDKASHNSSQTRIPRSRDETKNPPSALLKSCLSTSNTNSGAKPFSVEFTYEQDTNAPSPSRGVTVDIPSRDSPAELPSLPTYETEFGDEQEMNRVIDEDYVPTINISSSRWVADDDSPVDEGEILYDHDSSRGKNGDIMIPDLGEHNVVGSNQSRGKLSDSDGDEYFGDGSDEETPMDVDKEHCNSDDVEDSDGDNENEKEAQDVCRNINMLMGCRSVDEFERLNKIDEGTYGVVYRAKDKKTGEVVALKKVKMEKEREGFPLTSLREINILLSFHHPSIVDVKEVVVGSNLDSIFMVMEYMEHDLKGLMESMKQPFSQSEVKCLMLQLLSGVKYLHDNWVLHRDLKTSNLLLNNRGELKICDFGLSRQYGSPLKPYTHLVVTLWYRAPELLLGTKEYSTAIDMWSLGCIMAELLSKEPLFNGKTELDQIDKIFRILGTPNETIWPGYTELPGVKINFVKHQYNLLRKKFPPTSFTGSPVLSDSGFDLLNRLLAYDPERRISAEAALNHEWFREVPLPKVKEFMPTFPAQHAQDRRLRRALKSPDPLEEQRLKELRGEFGSGGLFG